MTTPKSISAIIVATALFVSCKERIVQDGTAKKMQDSASSLAPADSAKPFPTKVTDTNIVFNDQLHFTKTPLSFSFTYNGKNYKFYTYANYLLPSPKSKNQEKSSMIILASKEEGLQMYDDLVDGGFLQINNLPVLNQSIPLKGAVYIDGTTKSLPGTGSLIFTSADKNFISGTFTLSGVGYNLTKDKSLGKFNITDGRFESIPVNVHRVKNVADGWQDGNP